MPGMSFVELRPLPKHGLFQIRQEALWSHDKKGYYVVIPYLFIFNGASVPKWCWPMLDASPPFLVVPGLVHDYLVRCKAEVHWYKGFSPRKLDADLAAEIMDDVMEWAGVTEDDRKKIVTALKVTAPFYWHNKPIDWDPR